MQETSSPSVVAIGQGESVGSAAFVSRAHAPRARTLGAVVADLIALTKPRLSSLVLCTTAGGIWLAHGTLARWTSVAALAGTTLAVAGAHALVPAGEQSQFGQGHGVHGCFLRQVRAQVNRRRRRPRGAGPLRP